MVKKMVSYLAHADRQVRKWAKKNPRKVRMIKIGIGVGATAALGYGCYKVLDMSFRAGYAEGVDYAVDKLTPHEGICRLQFKHPIEHLDKELWPACMQHLKDDGINTIFTQDDKEIVALFSAVKDTDIKGILEGFVEAGGDPDRMAVMLEAPLRA